MKFMSVVPTLLLLCCSMVGCSMRAVTPNTRVAKSALDYNLQIEEAQDKNLLMNVWRAKKRYPLYLTDISKVTGSLTNTYTLGLSIPFGHVKGYQLTTTPSATFTTTPTFDVNLLDTQDFMRGFLTPVSPATFAHFWRQGWPRELLLHLLVRELRVVDVSGKVNYFYDRGHRYLTNYPDPAKADQKDLAEFAEWAHFLARFDLAGCQKFVLTKLTTKDFGAVDSATKSLASGLSISSEEKVAQLARKTTTRTTGNFKGAAKTAETTTKENSEELSGDAVAGPVYNFAVPFDILVDDRAGDAGVIKLVKSCVLPPREAKSGRVEKPKDAENQSTESELNEQERDIYEVLMQDGKRSSNTEGVARPDEREAVIRALFAAKISGDKTIPMLVELSLRSPEGVLYYLGELARLEDYHAYTQRACINDFPQPIFVAYSTANRGKQLPANCGSLLEIEDRDHETVFIPPPHDPNNPHDMIFGEPGEEALLCGQPLPPIEDEKEKTLRFEHGVERALRKQLQCNSGRSTAALDLLSDLIALQKSAKEFPTTPTVRIIGQ